MRKWIVWSWMLVLCIGLVQGSLAEAAEVEYDLVMFDGSSAYAYAVPKGWLPIEATAEEKAEGQIGKWQSPDQNITMTVFMEEFSYPDDSDSPLRELIKESRYPNMEMYEEGGYFAHYENLEEGIQGWITTVLDDEYNYYFARLDFVFASQDDETMQQVRAMLDRFRENMNEHGESDD